MQIDEETIWALQCEIQLYRFAEKHDPQLPISRVKGCGCMGPPPPLDCRCVKIGKLVRAFLDIEVPNATPPR